MRPVSVVGIAQLPVKKRYEWSLRRLGAAVVQRALAAAGGAVPGALYLANMLGDELQGQKHLAALVADEAGLAGIEALEVRAAMASGAAALRTAYLAVASGVHDCVVVAGVEKMSVPGVTQVLAKALDAQKEVPDGATLIGQNARLMDRYLAKYDPPRTALAQFAVNAHANARHNEHALFRDKQISATDVLQSRLITSPIRLFDCAPICEGAAAVVLAPTADARAYGERPVRLLASAVATDRFRLDDRADPLFLRAAAIATERAFSQAGVDRADVSFVEPHDAFTIMACLLLEAAGFAARGAGWRLAADGDISLEGRLPLTTMGGLKARGHPIGATGLYQVCEIFLQLTGQAGTNQLHNADIALMQSVGGVASTVLTHIFAI